MMQSYQENTQPQRNQRYGASVRKNSGRQLQAVVQPSTAETVKLVHNQKQKTFYLENVENVHSLFVDAPTLEFQMKRTSNPRNFEIHYFPKGEKHAVNIKYAGVHVDGSPFQLTPLPPAINFNHEDKSFSIENVHDVEKLHVKSESLPYEIFRDKESDTTFHVKYESGEEIHDVRVLYDDEEIEQGKFRLVPKGKKEAYAKGKVKTVNGRAQIVEEGDDDVTGNFNKLGINAQDRLWDHKAPVVAQQQQVQVNAPVRQAPMNTIQSSMGQLIMENSPQPSTEMSNRADPQPTIQANPQSVEMGGPKLGRLIMENNPQQMQQPQMAYSGPQPTQFQPVYQQPPQQRYAPASGARY